MIPPIPDMSSNSCGMLCQMAGGGCRFGWVASPGLIPGPTHEFIFAMEAHGRAFALELQQPEASQARTFWFADRKLSGSYCLFNANSR